MIQSASCDVRNLWLFSVALQVFVGVEVRWTQVHGSHHSLVFFDLKVVLASLLRCVWGYYPHAERILLHIDANQGVEVVFEPASSFWSERSQVCTCVQPDLNFPTSIFH